ncbi:MAG: hypothetical protein L6R38_004865 [Xanthoria sp. 2 TBL-2021]|nr:MAG: hypothetical protein L6R38_004865 [Xanthoria sp. 2 TBL-2021]
MELLEVPISPVSGNSQIQVTEARHTRKIYYLGGDYNQTASGTILQNQIYVEQLTPAGGVTQPKPLVLLHGGNIAGDLWLNKPDGGRGWASFFLDRGYQVYIPDTWGMGRSGPAADGPRGGGSTVEGAERAFTAPERYNEYYQARFHTQWPGVSFREPTYSYSEWLTDSHKNGSLNDRAFNNFYSRFHPTSVGPEVEGIMRSALCDLLRTYISGQAIFIAHVMGSAYAIQASDACPELVAAHISLEGDQSPFQSYIRASEGIDNPIPYRPYGVSNIPLTFETPVTESSQLRKASVGETTYTEGLLSNVSCVLQQNPANKLVNVAKVPMLFFVGEASVHALYDHCQVAFLRQAGVNVTFTKLADEGVRGNGHFSMLEENSDQIALLVARWIEERLG